ncbi:thioesterase family protein [Nocardioides sp. YIM 152315]|uniref:thioesterase family protein n=1 Tax=Nocardioides sp. YIM 152315 TaxID=3031760 RepID=UPI0023DBB286|nr:thioesterase family protein [Nocardioides sp. YIM 152315]MDF1603969.1 thioesterase family protein [Nocardioides sp. YIM 152315]
MTLEFDDHTAVRAVSDTSYAAEVDPGWVVGGGVNGGYLLALIGTALRETFPKKPDPLAVSAHYLSAATPGPATVVVDVRREGGSVGTASAELRQGEETRIAALATYGDLERLGDDVRTTAEEPVLPPPDECVANTFAPKEILELAPMMGRFDMRFHPDHVGWAVGQPSGRGEIAAWFRLTDGREPDPASLLMVVDALPPVTFDLGMMGWAPTLELTAHVRARPAPGWLKVRHATRNLAGGMFEEDCEVWDSAGRLVAQSRQLARQPRPVS